MSQTFPPPRDPMQTSPRFGRPRDPDRFPAFIVAAVIVVASMLAVVLYWQNSDAAEPPQVPPSLLTLQPEKAEAFAAPNGGPVVWRYCVDGLVWLLAPTGQPQRSYEYDAWCGTHHAPADDVPHAIGPRRSAPAVGAAM